MSGEGDFIALMRNMATDPGARGLMDDAAVLQTGSEALVLTHDMMVEGVHWLSGDPAETVAWKLVAVNMSDLAAKGALPRGVLLGFSLRGDMEWDRAFAAGLKDALTHFGAPLLGGDTVAVPNGAPRSLGLTAIGAAPPSGAPSRSGARVGDLLYVSGTIGDAGAGLALLTEGGFVEGVGQGALIAAYRRPVPDLALGRALAPLVTTMADISDGLLIDADRIARASGCAARIELERMPLSAAFVEVRGDTPESRLFAATCGDDYRLLFAADPGKRAEIEAVARRCGVTLSHVGCCSAGQGMTLAHHGQVMPLPESLGYEHR